MTVTRQGLHPAEHRALRELHASARQLANHWSSLGDRLGGRAGSLLRRGSDAAAGLLSELAPRTAAQGLPGRPAAQGVGTTLAGVRTALSDRTLEVNQALRLASLDVVHVVTLLGYLAELADHRGDEEWTRFHRRWAEELAVVEADVRAEAAQAGRAPDRAVEPLDRAGHVVAMVAGTAGEAIDRALSR